MSARSRILRPSPEAVSLVPAAHIVKSYNTGGEIIIRFTSALLEDYPLQEPVFLYFEGLPVPFFIEKFHPKGNNGALVKFRSVNDLSHSEELIGKEIFIDRKQCTGEEAEREAGAGELLIGFILQDQNRAEIGTVTGFLDYPGNPCLEIKRKAGTKTEAQKTAGREKAQQNSKETKAAGNEKEPGEQKNSSLLIPFHEELILKLDPRKKLLRMQIPSGLLEL